MAIRYSTASPAMPPIEAMPVVTATQLKNATADVFDLVARERAVAIHRHDKPRGVLLSPELYEQWLAQGANRLEEPGRDRVSTAPSRWRVAAAVALGRVGCVGLGQDGPGRIAPISDRNPG